MQQALAKVEGTDAESAYKRLELLAEYVELCKPQSGEFSSSKQSESMRFISYMQPKQQRALYGQILSDMQQISGVENEDLLASLHHKMRHGAYSRTAITQTQFNGWKSGNSSPTNLVAPQVHEVLLEAIRSKNPATVPINENEPNSDKMPLTTEKFIDNLDVVLLHTYRQMNNPAQRSRSARISDSPKDKFQR